MRGPVLWGFVDIGCGTDTLFEGSLSPFVLGMVADSMGVFCVFPFVDATEFLSPFDILGKPFCCAGLLLPFSETPFMPPFTDSKLPLREDL